MLALASEGLVTPPFEGFLTTSPFAPGQPRVSAAACVTVDGKTLLVRHKVRGWEFPVGKVEGDELLDVAAARELKEEAGILVEPFRLKLVAIFQLRKDFGHWINFFHAAVLEKRPEMIPGVDDALIDVAWIDLSLGISIPSLSETTLDILYNSTEWREDRDPGMQTHCFDCRGRIPCSCMGFAVAPTEGACRW